MKIEEIDENFAGNTADKKGLTAYSPLNKPFGLYGIFFDEGRGCYARMPHEVAKKVSWGVEVLSTTTAGGRIRFSTDSQKVGVAVRWKYLVKMNNMPMTGYIGLVLLEEKEGGKYKHIRTFKPAIDDDGEGFFDVADVTADFRDKEKRVRNFILYCPLYNDYITDIEILLEEGAVVKEGNAYRDIPPIVYYGSSITQGGSVSRPDCAYQAFIERWTNVDFINLGFSGNAKGEKEMVEYLASLSCSVFVCDYDHNAPTVAHLRDTHYPLYEAFRATHPTTPILFMSRPAFDLDIVELDERFAVIEETYLRAKKAGDHNVYLLDGRHFFEEDIREQCVVDFSHPNDLGHLAMARAVYGVLKDIL